MRTAVFAAAAAPVQDHRSRPASQRSAGRREGGAWELEAGGPPRAAFAPAGAPTTRRAVVPSPRLHSRRPALLHFRGRWIEGRGRRKLHSPPQPPLAAMSYVGAPAGAKAAPRNRHARRTPSPHFSHPCRRGAWGDRSERVSIDLQSQTGRAPCMRSRWVRILRLTAALKTDFPDDRRACPSRNQATGRRCGRIARNLNRAPDAPAQAATRFETDGCSPC